MATESAVDRRDFAGKVRRGRRLKAGKESVPGNVGGSRAHPGKSPSGEPRALRRGRPGAELLGPGRDESQERSGRGHPVGPWREEIAHAVGEVPPCVGVPWQALEIAVLTEGRGNDLVGQ